MQNRREEIREFLTSRRARITPEAAGLPRHRDRRVPGLRRGEVAALAGVSVEYYSRLERGSLAGASESVLGSLATALRLDDAERRYLLQLARQDERRAAGPADEPPQWTAGPSVHWMLEAIEAAPALIGDGRLDLLAWNRLGGALVDRMIDTTTSGHPNFARFAFLEPAARDFYPNWEGNADTVVAMLRTEAGRHPNSRRLHELVGELSTRSDQFRARWSRHDVVQHATGTKHFHHHIAGPLALAFDSWEVPDHPGTRLTAYTAEPGSPSHDGLRLLASWASERAAV